jgi:hypothetical protein
VSVKEQRKNQRFELRLPCELVRSGNGPAAVSGETKNVSSSGVLFTTQAAMQVGEPIEFVITLPTGAEGHQVRLKCLGKVVRVEDVPTEPEAGNGHNRTGVAATLERFEFVRAKAV